MTIPALVALSGTAFLYALWLQIRESRRLCAQRLAYLDDCKAIFDHGTKAITVAGFPRLDGHYRGHRFDLQLSKDTLDIRKLPVLWLLVTLPMPIAVRATFDLMVRPRGIEVFSRFSQLPVQVGVPAGFPPDCNIRTDDPEGLLPEDLLRRHVSTIFADPLAKELVISPKGLRIVVMAEEAHRGKYLLFRDSELAGSPYPPQNLRPLLDALLALKSDIDAHAGTPAS